MTNSKATKKALFMSVISLMLCFTMLMGATFAWFTDTVKSSNNRIVAGNLDVDLVMYKETEGKYVSIADGSGDIFSEATGNGINWEPGKTEIVYLGVQNKGSLALKYNIILDIIDGEIPLSGSLEYALIDSAEYEANKYADWTAVKTAAGGQVASMPTGTGLVAAENGVLDEIMRSGEEDETDYFALAVHMKEEAGNEYQNGSITIDLTVLATQVEAELDSFDDTYDEDAPFGTYIELNAGDDLLAAMASAEEGMPLSIKLNGDVEWPTEAHHGENDITPASSIVIDGNGYTLTATGSGVTPLGDTKAPMTLKNIKIVDKSVSYNEGAWEFTYLEIGGSSLTCNNVTFADEIQFGTNATFTNCSFESNEESVYAVWVEGGSAAFNNCTFTGYRGLKAHEDYGSEISSVVVKDCTFSNITKKPGIALGTLNADTAISVTGSSFINCQAGDQGLYIYETDTDVSTINFTNENNTVLSNVSEVVEIATKAELFAFAERVNDGDSMSKVLVRLTSDIDLENESWTPIGQTGATEFKGIFDGQNHTIKNLKIDSSEQTGADYSSALFGWIESHAQDITIKNVIVDGATVTGHHNVAVIAGYMEGDSVVENCHVKNATLKNTHANEDACGDKTGVIAGYVASEVTVKGCTATDCTVSGGRDAGQLIGASYVDPADCSAANVTVSATGDCTGANIAEDLVGRKLG